MDFLEILRNENLSLLQRKCIERVSKMFDHSLIDDFSFSDYFYKTTFGKHQDKEIYVVVIKWIYQFHNFEFVIAENQLEYYISKGNKIKFECNLEDFWEENIHLEKYLNYLQTDLEKISSIKNH